MRTLYWLIGIPLSSAANRLFGWESSCDCLCGDASHKGRDRNVYLIRTKAWILAGQ